MKGRINMNIGDMHKINKQTMVQQTIEYLREYILNMENGDSSKLPSEGTIAKNMGISRLTIREALKVLENEGLISKSQGSNTMITTFARKLSENIDYTGELGSFLKDCGYDLEVDVLSHRWDKADEKTAEILNIKRGEEILIVEKIFFADGKQAVYCINRLPKKILKDLDFSEELFGQSMFDFIEENTNFEFSHDYMELIPELVTKDLSEILNLDINSPLLRADVIKYATDGKVVMYNSEYYVDELIRFNALRSNYGAKLSKLGSSINKRTGD
ncbi:GntR family transcriptional regulator [Tissierella carlieri]|uniref:GntR family transcriptional regulator n=2 Tax=Tissierella TaxID=41273 RepID=UPI00386B5A07